MLHQSNKAKPKENGEWQEKEEVGKTTGMIMY